jgi:hypothetical protein
VDYSCYCQSGIEECGILQLLLVLLPVCMGTKANKAWRRRGGEVWKHVGTSTRAGGADHRDKLLCGACWLTEMPAGMSNAKAS